MNADATAVQHTPGPWIDGAERDGRITTHYVKAGTCNIYLNRGVGQTEAEARANIRLIASAPSLLRERNHLLEANRRLVEALEAARFVFLEYAEIHKAKNTEAGAFKADSNLRHANKLSEALTFTKGQQ